MKISKQTIPVLGSIITGDSRLSSYRSGRELITFFNPFQFCAEDTYDNNFPSRWYYAEKKLQELNDTPVMKDVIVAAFDPRNFIGTKFNITAAAEHLNQFLEFDGYEIRPFGKKWNVCKLNDSQISLSHPYVGSAEVTHVFIDEQIQKCDKKLLEEDFDGAITNARSLIEAVLTAIEREFDSNPPEYDGNLPKLYKRVQKHLNLCPGQEDLADCLRQILSGLTSVVSGLSTLRNTMSDSHVISYKPAEHHARLAVNTAKTLCEFLFETKEYQMRKRKGNTT